MSGEIKPCPKMEPCEDHPRTLPTSTGGTGQEECSPMAHGYEFVTDKDVEVTLEVTRGWTGTRTLRILVQKLKSEREAFKQVAIEWRDADGDLRYAGDDVARLVEEDARKRLLSEKKGGGKS